MLIKLQTEIRSNQEEIMDDFNLKGEDLKFVLKDIDNVNLILGGHRVTKKGIKSLLKSSDKKHFKIADIGCGSGATLRHLSQWAKRNQFNIQFYGIDANTNIVEQAKELSSGFENIQYLNQNIFSEEFKSNDFDIITCCLTLHHFSDKSILNLIPTLQEQAKLGVVVNDLHRNTLAYWLFKLYAFFFMKSKIAKQDGAISILRSFKKEDLLNYSQLLHLKSVEIKWCWAFRYLWLIKR